jgi:hypothetical protein
MTLMSKEKLIPTLMKKLFATNQEEDVADNDHARKGGRKIGTTIEANKDNIANIKLATKSLSSNYLVIQAAAKLAGKKVKKIQLRI